MAWPNTRLRTYNEGTPVEPDDLNEIQDAVTDGGKHGLRTAMFGIETAVGHNSTFEYLLEVSSETFEWHIPLPAGSRIQAIRIRCNDGTGSEISCRARSHEDGGSPVNLGAAAGTSDSSGWQTIALTDIGPITVTETKYVAVQVTVTNDHTLTRMAVDYDHP